VTLYRCFGWSSRAPATSAHGALWVPREWQGDGRHDNPEAYGCLYLADRELSALVEQLAPFRTQPLQPALLRRGGLPLAVASYELDGRAELIDLDDTRVLVREALRPSAVATRRREITQPQALRFHGERPGAAGLCWWSTFEATWANVTLFDRGVDGLALRDARELTVRDPAVLGAAEFLGLG